MAELTSDQAGRLAALFLELSRAVDDFAFDHRASLSQADKDKLEELRRALSDQSIHFTAQAISIALDDLAPVVARVGEVTASAQEAVRHIADVGRAIRIASAAVAIGTALAAGNPGAAVSAIGDLAAQIHA